MYTSPRKKFQKLLPSFGHFSLGEQVTSFAVRGLQATGVGGLDAALWAEKMNHYDPLENPLYEALEAF